MSNLSNQQINSSFNGLLQVPGGITSSLQTVQDGNGNPTALSISSTQVSGITSSSFRASINNVPVADTVNRLISDGFGDCLSVKDFGATGDGVTNDTSAIQAALATNLPIVFPKGTYHISSTLTLTGNFVFLGGVIDVAAGQVLTINGVISAQAVQIFTDTSSVTSGLPGGAGTMKTIEVYPQWFGALGNGSNDDTAAINAALVFMANTGGTLFVPQGNYIITSSITISTAYPLTLKGTGIAGYKNNYYQYASCFVFNVLSNTNGFVLNKTSTFNLSNISIRRGTNAASGDTGVGLLILGGGRNLFSFSTVSAFATNIATDIDATYSLQPVDMTFTNVHSYQPTNIGFDFRACASISLNQCSGYADSNPTMTAFVILGRQDAVSGCDSVKCNNCIFIGDHGGSYNAVIVYKTIDSNFDGCVFEGGTNAFNFSLTGNIGFKNLRHLDITNCWFNGQLGRIVITTGAVNFAFTSNRCDGYSSATELMRLVSISSATANIVIANNDFGLRTNPAIFCQNLTGVVVNGNTISAYNGSPAASGPAILFDTATQYCIATNNRLDVDWPSGTPGVQNTGTNNVVANNASGHVN